MLREPAVAGLFYDQNPEMLRDSVESLWPASEPEPAAAFGAMVPHAGYVYSGRTAAKVYARLNPADVYIILGPNHTGRGWPIAVSDAEAWVTPLGQVPVDVKLSRAIIEQCEIARLDSSAHQKEHSLEVQLPFLQAPRRPFSLVAICLGSQDISLLSELGKGIARAIQATNRRCLVLASSDMNHFASLNKTKVLDQQALDKVLARDPRGLLETVEQQKISMCGANAVTAMLVATQALGATTADLIDYTTSAEATGEEDRVVGYAGVIVR